MARTVAIGVQDFEQLIKNDYFYVDKTKFIKEWWESGDAVTLITRPRRFGKTLTMNMLEHFFSIKYAGQGELFEKLSIWKEQKYHDLQGAYPVISLTFANVKEQSYEKARLKINMLLEQIYQQNLFLKKEGILSERETEYYDRVSKNMDEVDASLAIHRLSEFLNRYYGKKVIILLDEYDTPMQEAYINGYWDEMVSFTRNMFNSAFKTNPYLERAVMTGITRVSKESIFSDLNNLKVVTSTSDNYTDIFGFTEDEVFAAMDEQGFTDKDKVKEWYDGFTFGRTRDIYNPWSILNYLDTGKYKPYWANTSSNSLVALQLQQGDADIKKQFERLLQGESFEAEIEEEIVFSQLNKTPGAVWSLMLASGYLKVLDVMEPETLPGQKQSRYTLCLTNLEVEVMFERLIREWFMEAESDYNAFIKALLIGDVEAMNDYMNEVAAEVFSSFDVGKRSSGKSQPERFYHGFVLGLLVELQGKYYLRSNRESGFCRYDVMLEPIDAADDAMLIEFKVRKPMSECNLKETVAAALRQIGEKRYDRELIDRGILPERIRKYGFAFEGKHVLIGDSSMLPLGKSKTLWNS